MNKKTTKQTPIKSDKNDGSGTLRHPAEYAQFVRWIATPEPFREIKNQGDFAESIGVHQDTLTDWKKRDGFWGAVKEEISRFGRERTPNVIAALYKNILQKGGAPESKLWLQYVEGWREEQGLLVQPDGELTVEEREAIERIKRKHSKKRRKDEEISYPL